MDWLTPHSLRVWRHVQWQYKSQMFIQISPEKRNLSNAGWFSLTTNQHPRNKYHFRSIASHYRNDNSANHWCGVWVPSSCCRRCALCESQHTTERLVLVTTPHCSTAAHQLLPACSTSTTLQLGSSPPGQYNSWLDSKYLELMIWNKWIYLSSNLNIMQFCQPIQCSI